MARAAKANGYDAIGSEHDEKQKIVRRINQTRAWIMEQNNNEEAIIRAEIAADYYNALQWW